MNDKVKDYISQMTLEEKASLCSGKNFWYMKGIERLGIPSVMVTDGPHGLRKQAGSSDHLGINESVKSTCFPPAVASSSTWDRDTLYEIGKAIGEEAVQEKVAVVLGPGTNIKRSPLCGRNFEYFSEDPYLAGEMSAQWIKGVQSQGIGTSLKHFAANNQEKARLVGNSVVDERALREIYLTAFERAVKQAQPWTLMCSYNRINDVYSCENKWLLTDVLRNEWGFKGLVMTDWGAMDRRADALKAGLELEMPGPADWNDKKIADAVKDGTLDEAVLDQAVERLLTLILEAAKVEEKPYDPEQHHALARKAAAEAMVLLKNDGMLPLKKGKKYAVVGAFAESPRYQGAGSSKINPHKVDSVLDALREQGIEFAYAPGYCLEHDQTDAELLAQAKEAAAGADGVIVVAGLPDSYESEGFDRTHLKMPESHCTLIQEMAEINSNVTVVLMGGAPVEMPWREKTGSILLAYLGGEAAGSACADVLTGAVNPSGRLAETFPLCLEDTPCYQYYGTDDLDVEYRESIFVGYRYYDWAKKEVAYPFGYGLSYTTFSYDGMKVIWNDKEKKGTVQVTVTNTGAAPGSEVVQLYVGKEDTKLMRAPKELKGFAKLYLEPGESKIAEMELDARSFSYYDVKDQAWTAEDGIYQIYAGASSRNLLLKQEVSVSGKMVEGAVLYRAEELVKNGHFQVPDEVFEACFGGKLPVTKKTKLHTVNERLGDVINDPEGKKQFGAVIQGYEATFQGEDDASKMMRAMAMDLPLRSLASFGMMSLNEVEEKIRLWNQTVE